MDLYSERLTLKPGLTLRSAGNDNKGEIGLKRAESTILDGGKVLDNMPGVLMAEGATLDGFTVTNVGRYDEAEWKKHHATQGNDQPHEHIGPTKSPGISIVGVTCTVRHSSITSATRASPSRA